MADLSSIERRKLERLLRMGGGYVLDFSDRTFSEFFEEHTRRDINAAVYRERGTSKANRMRGFWAVEGNHLVGKVIQALILYGQAENCLGDEQGLTELTDDCWKIASRMMRDTPVAELDALTATVDERDFETVAQHVREAIEKNQPEAVLDRLHTFVIKYVRTLCEQRGVEVYAEGKFPPPVHLGGRACGWTPTALQAWVDDPAGYSIAIAPSQHLAE
ncbi:MAG: AlpA family phage regulatory protein [Pseudomonadota bacterium]